MNNLATHIDIQEQEYTPAIRFDEHSKTLTIAGSSLPDDTKGFYQPLLDWMEEYLNNPDLEKKLNIIFRLDYFNTSSSKMIYELLAKVEKKKNILKSVRIYWHYDVINEPMLESGKHFADLVDLPFEFHSYI